MFFKCRQLIQQQTNAPSQPLPCWQSLTKKSTQKSEHIEKLIEKYYVKISFKAKRGRPRKDFNDEEKKMAWNIPFS